MMRGQTIVRAVVLASFLFLYPARAQDGKKSQAAAAESAAAAQAARDVLAKFEKSANAMQTQTRTGKMLRMECLVGLAKVGPAAAPVLVDALKTESPEIRVLAAEAL